ncbi:MAG: calcium-binding protein, partial [Epsilonproteobacteria bacterium]|nr:calcium-binding protein [Campylobacterota bacterium]
DAGENDISWDMGIYNEELASIGNHVWYDENRNGLQESNEKGVEAVKVILFDDNDIQIAETSTDSEGIYQFYGLIPGNYYLSFSDIPVGYTITEQDTGEDTQDSDVNTTTSRTVITNLTSGEHDLNWDMGIYNQQRAGLGDTIWYDGNQNGIQDPFEYGVDAVKVTLYQADGTKVATTVSDSQGKYKFINLIPGNYYLIFSDLPVSYQVTTQDTTTDTTDSDVDPTTLRTETFSLEEGDYDLRWDMGIYNNQTSAIGDTVWYDDNHNGLQDPFEIGTPDILVRLYQRDGTQIDTTLTDEKGNYTFRDITPGDYYLQFSHLPVGYEVTLQNQGAEDKDSDVDPSTLQTTVTTITTGEYQMDWDLGLYNKHKATLGDSVWYDTDH